VLTPAQRLLALTLASRLAAAADSPAAAQRCSRGASVLLVVA
jgi:hypothetical protein